MKFALPQFALPRRLADPLAAHLRMGRVSNLPTVWSDCIAAWTIAKGSFEPTLAFMIVAISAVYVGGMYLNDACDAEWDAVHKPDRPIPSGRVGRNTAYAAAFACFAFGLSLAWGEGWLATLVCLALVATVVAYDVVHKVAPWSPLLMGACRALIYVAVAAAAANRFPLGLVLWGLALGAYVVGLSYLARAEAFGRVSSWSALGLLAVPPLLKLTGGIGPVAVLLVSLYAVWIAFALSRLFPPDRRDVGAAVSRLLAGICLVDLLACASEEFVSLWTLAILLCLWLALVLHRRIPGT